MRIILKECVVIAICALVMATSSAWGNWAENGIVLCDAVGTQIIPKMVGDGMNGALVVWQDGRNGNPDVYVQKVDGSGTILWAANGAALCTDPGNQYAPAIVSDGSGGAIVAWQDERAGNADIYAQRIDASGLVLWAVDGVVICSAAGSQRRPAIASDGMGGAVVTWYDYRNGGYADIYAQRIDAAGSILWTIDGVALCTDPGNQYYPSIESDGSGGAIVTWVDARNAGATSSDVYAQRVDAGGSVLWTPDGVALCSATGGQTSPVIVSDCAGGAVVAWSDARVFYDDLYAQRVNASGAVQWTTDGVPLCAAYYVQRDLSIASDGAGGVIATWRDNRSPASVGDIYAQRIDASGVPLWAANGIAVTADTFQQEYPKITLDGEGGAVVVWQDIVHIHDTGWDIRAQRLDASGAPLWTVGGVDLCTSLGNQLVSAVVTDGAGGAIAIWQDGGGGLSPDDVYAQRVDAGGNVPLPIATLLQSYSAAFEGSSVRVTWTLSEIDQDIHFAVFRASPPAQDYAELQDIVIVRDALSFTLKDADCQPGSTYKYRIECCLDGAGPRVLFETDAVAVPALSMSLDQNYPNPFNPRTVIRFYLPEATEVALDVYDIAGRRVARLAEGRMYKGYHEVTWDGRGTTGIACSSGVYFGRLTAGKSTVSRKIVLAR